jgi:hypothetical protein
VNLGRSGPVLLDMMEGTRGQIGRCGRLLGWPGSYHRR